jgi:hypothetical protein
MTASFIPGTVLSRESLARILKHLLPISAVNKTGIDLA